MKEEIKQLLSALEGSIVQLQEGADQSTHFKSSTYAQAALLKNLPALQFIHQKLTEELGKAGGQPESPSAIAPSADSQ